MARKPTRTRRVLLAATLALLAVVLAAWPYSCWRRPYITQCRDLNLAPGDSRGDPAQWMLIDTIRGIYLRPGGLLFMKTTFRSKSMDSVFPTSRRMPAGWRLGHAPAEVGSSFSNDFIGSFRSAVRFKGWSDWAVPGLSMNSKPGAAVSVSKLSCGFGPIVVLLSGIGFALWFPSRKYTRRLANNQCPRCGYDRKGLALAAACPECGETSAPAPSAS